mgnify:CR=1 FL=1
MLRPQSEYLPIHLFITVNIRNKAEKDTIIRKIIQIICEQKATMIVDHIFEILEIVSSHENPEISERSKVNRGGRIPIEGGNGRNLSQCYRGQPSHRKHRQADVSLFLRHLPQMYGYLS